MTKMADLEISHFWSRRGKRALRDIAPPPFFGRFFNPRPKIEVSREGARSHANAPTSLPMATSTHSEPNAGAAASP